MPVRFRGISEYSSMYKWQPSYRSSQFIPQKEQALFEAGLRSDQLNLLMEPLFTKKKQVPHRRPEAGDCLIWMQDDFNDLVSESSTADQQHESKSKRLLLSKKGDGDHSKLSSKNKKIVSSCTKKETKLSASPGVADESRSTWEKDKQSEYIQKLRKEEEDSPKEKKIFKKHKDDLHQSPTKESKSLKKNKDTISKLKSNKITLNNSVQKSSPTKSPSKSPVKKEKRFNQPLRYRPLHHRMLSAHQSEYQQMYKKPSRFIPSSPLISALDVVHSSSPAIPPHKSPKTIGKSEYASTYKTQSPLSKSMPSFSSPSSPSLRLKVRDLSASPNSERRFHSKTQSEYTKQFPGQQLPRDVSKKLFDEALHNKLNREGTSFDKDHVNQICSPKNKCWDMSSAGSEISVRNSERSSTNYVRSNVAEEHEKSKLALVAEIENEACQEEKDVESIPVSEKDSLDIRSGISNNALNQPMPVARKLAWGEEEHSDVDNDENSTIQGSADSVSVTGYVGRLPTPQLRELGGAMRTHHDLTTPSPGGALLTSPNASDKNKKFVHSVTSTSHADDINIDDTPVKLSKTMPTPNGQTKAILDKELAKTAVSPTTSPSKLALKQEENKAHENNSKYSKTYDVKSSKNAEIPRRMQRVLRAPIQGALRSQEFQHCGDYSRPSTAFGRISLASSASIASADDLLQRSLQRKDFWKTR